MSSAENFTQSAKRKWYLTYYSCHFLFKNNFVETEKWHLTLFVEESHLFQICNPSLLFWGWVQQQFYQEI